MRIDNINIIEKPPHVSTQSTGVVSVQPLRITEPHRWKRGLMNCCDDGFSWSICKAFLCPWVVFGQLARQTGYGDCCLCGVAYCVLFSPICIGVDLSCFVHKGLRKRVRETKGLPPEPCSDFFVTWFCGCCALAQEAFEMDQAPV
jgi:Cys-rich protein (TIGR01571 family)